MVEASRKQPIESSRGLTAQNTKLFLPQQQLHSLRGTAPAVTTAALQLLVESACRVWQQLLSQLHLVALNLLIITMQCSWLCRLIWSIFGACNAALHSLSLQYLHLPCSPCRRLSLDHSLRFYATIIDENILTPLTACLIGSNIA